MRRQSLAGIAFRLGAAAAFAYSVVAPVMAKAQPLPDYQRAQLQAPRVKDIAEIKGTQARYLSGLGIVFGLNGTGDGNTALTSSRYANLMNRLYQATSITPKDLQSKNVAIVHVTATLPANAVPGSRLDVEVSSAGDAKSVVGGNLVQTALRDVEGQRWAWVQGTVIGGGVASLPTTGRLPGGGAVEREVPSALEGEGRAIYLVLRNPDPTTAVHVAEAINQETRVEGGLIFPEGTGDLAWARDPRTVVVRVPEAFRDPTSLMRFIMKIEQVRIPTVDVEARVVIDKTTRTIVINGNVMVSPVAISHEGIVTAIDPVEGLNASGTPLQDLINALNALTVSPEQRIDIVQAIDRAGALHGKLEVR